MNNEPCQQCGLIDRYVKGEFSYCRPCHTEAQKRYLKNKAQGSTVETLKAPSRSLSFLLSQNTNLKLVCKNGHALVGDNLVVSSQRNGKHLRRRCRTCERNAKRVKYGLAPEVAPQKISDMLDSD